jgi:hypothetical protein
LSLLRVKEESNNMIIQRSMQVAPFLKGHRGTDHTPHVAPAISLSVRKLSTLKHLALRKRVWYRCLSHLERSIIDLTVQCVECIKSSKLATVVTAIVQKLDTAMESMVDRLVWSVGFSLTQKISEIANKLGNISAKSWATDRVFARYLAVMALNR